MTDGCMSSIKKALLIGITVAWYMYSGNSDRFNYDLNKKAMQSDNRPAITRSVEQPSSDLEKRIEITPSPGNSYQNNATYKNNITESNSSTESNSQVESNKPTESSSQTEATAPLLEKEYPLEKSKYPMPTSINVKYARFYDKNTHAQLDNVSGQINTKNIDFSKHFEIRTENYTIMRDDDWCVSKAWGKYLGSLPCKFMMFSWQIGNDLDEDHTKRVVALLESDKSAQNIFVRINHNGVLNDICRLYADPKVRKRNGFISQTLIGLPSMLLEEIVSEFARGDYYNPMNQTAVLYSNIDAISFHEIGHHKDSQRFSTDVWYTLARVIPPVTLYQEWQASMKHAHNDLSGEKNYEYYRFLIPAFGTYLLWFWGTLKYLGKKLFDLSEN